MQSTGKNPRHPARVLGDTSKSRRADGSRLQETKEAAPAEEGRRGRRNGEQETESCFPSGGRGDSDAPGAFSSCFLNQPREKASFDRHAGAPVGGDDEEDEEEVAGPSFRVTQVGMHRNQHKGDVTAMAVWGGGK